MQQIAGSAADPLFVVGSGRCGSTLLSEMLERHRSVLSLSEAFLEGGRRVLKLPSISGNDLWHALDTPSVIVQVLLTHRLEGVELRYDVDDGTSSGSRAVGVSSFRGISLARISSQPDQLAAQVADELRTARDAPPGVLLTRLFTSLARRADRDIWIERTGGSMWFTADLIRCFPNARFVHIHRDPGETIRSMAANTYFRLVLLRYICRTTERWDPYPDTWDRVLPLRDVPDGSAHRWAHPDAFDRDRFLEWRPPTAALELLWLVQMRAGLRALRKLPPDRVTDVSYERLVTDTDGALDALASHLGLPDDPTWAARARALVRPPCRDTADVSSSFVDEARSLLLRAADRVVTTS